ncbi:MAG: DUF4239 domain-containing protein [Anaerolineales bacterium]|nr:DUF4239 domain-containing protein [Anaerolineales bacterium]
MPQIFRVTIIITFLLVAPILLVSQLVRYRFDLRLTIAAIIVVMAMLFMLLRIRIVRSRFGSQYNFETVFFIPISIIIIRAIDLMLPESTISSSGFISDYIQWIGVFYAIMIPMILLRSWENLRRLDLIFSEEADSVRLLYEVLGYLPKESIERTKRFFVHLYRYVDHVVRDYHHELNTSEPNEKTKLTGDKLLQDVKQELRMLSKNSKKNVSDLQPMISEMLNRADRIMEVRRNRIAIANDRMFKSLQLIVTITSIAFLIPLYFHGFNTETPFLDNILIVCGTLLVIFIYLIIEDFDGPFEGIWRINDDSWRRLLDEMGSTLRNTETKHPDTSRKEKTRNIKRHKINLKS